MDPTHSNTNSNTAHNENEAESPNFPGNSVLKPVTNISHETIPTTNVTKEHLDKGLKTAITLRKDNKLEESIDLLEELLKQR